MKQVNMFYGMNRKKKTEMEIKLQCLKNGIWTKLRKLLKVRFNTKYLNPDSCLRHFDMLRTKYDKGLLLNKFQILGTDYMDKLDDDFTV
jgi:hypothetical protein